jgi:hypothetical protein
MLVVGIRVVSGTLVDVVVVECFFAWYYWSSHLLLEVVLLVIHFCCSGENSKICNQSSVNVVVPLSIVASSARCVVGPARRSSAWGMVDVVGPLSEVAAQRRRSERRCRVDSLSKVVVE